MKITLKCGHSINAPSNVVNALEECPGCVMEFELENSLEG
jgi:hypothetical protein